jgi:hypothetical protein
MPLGRLRKTALLFLVFYSLSLSTAFAIEVAPTDKVPPVVRDDVKFCLEKTAAFFEEISAPGSGLFWPKVQLYIAADDAEFIRLLKAKVKSVILLNPRVTPQVFRMNRRSSSTWRKPVATRKPWFTPPPTKRPIRFKAA